MNISENNIKNIEYLMNILFEDLPELNESYANDFIRLNSELLAYLLSTNAKDTLNILENIIKKAKGEIK